MTRTYLLIYYLTTYSIFVLAKNYLEDVKKLSYQYDPLRWKWLQVIRVSQKMGIKYIFRKDQVNSFVPGNSITLP